MPIQDAIDDLDAVDLAVAYGVTGPGGTQIPVAAVTLRRGAKLAPQELARSLSGLPEHERPMVVHVVREIALTTWYRPLTAKLTQGRAAPGRTPRLLPRRSGVPAADRRGARQGGARGGRLIEEESPLVRMARRWRRLDAAPPLTGVARITRELLPGDSSHGDPLSTAEGQPSQLLARYLTEVSNRPSAVRELGLAALQVYQVVSERSGRGRGERDVAILFTDLVDFSRWALAAGDEAALQLLREVGTVVERAVRDRDGEVVKRLGDGLMAVFADPVDAVSAACAAQSGVVGIEVEGYRPRIRAGVHVGRPRRLGGDYLGVDVNIAARVAAGSKGDVLVSEPVRERLDEKRFTIKRRWAFRAKGAPRDLRVYAVALRDESA